MKHAVSLGLLLAASTVAQAQTAFPHPDNTLVPLSMYCREPGLVALTFDDGPSDNFPAVLSTLQQHNVKATFFLLGAKLTFQTRIAQAQAAVNQGHQIENHSWDHADLSRLNDTQLIEQVDSTNRIIEDTLGVKPRFIRPPYGRINVTQGIPIWDMGYGVASWNLDSKDYTSTAGWTPEHSYNEIASKINGSNPAKDSFIILMHDASTTSLTRLGDIITTIQAKGYQLVTLNECADAGR